MYPLHGLSTLCMVLMQPPSLAADGLKRTTSVLGRAGVSLTLPPVMAFCLQPSSNHSKGEPLTGKRQPDKIAAFKVILLLCSPGLMAHFAKAARLVRPAARTGLMNGYLVFKVPGTRKCPLVFHAEKQGGADNLNL